MHGLPFCCIDACIYKRPRTDDPWNEGLSKRRPIYMPFPQATPPVVVVDPDACVDFKTHKCPRPCVDACERKAMDFDQKPRFEEIKVGAIILATGFRTFDARRIPAYGYGRYPGVYTSLEVERLLNASGPTGGELVMRDGSQPKRVAIVHCVGSRDANTNAYCSRVCCMYSLKLAHLVRERSGAEVTEFYIDMRTPGKGYEEFYERVQKKGTRFVRGPGRRGHRGRRRPGRPRRGHAPGQGTPCPRGHGGAGGRAWSPSRTPKTSAGSSTSAVAMRASSPSATPSWRPVSTFTDGIFLAGACQGPKDIPDTVAQAGAAAAEVLAMVDRGSVEVEPATAFIDADACSGCRTCVGMCPFSAISFDPVTNVASVNEVLCKGCGTCVAACPSGAAQQHLFTDRQIFAELGGVLNAV